MKQTHARVTGARPFPRRPTKATSLAPVLADIDWGQKSWYNLYFLANGRFLWRMQRTSRRTPRRAIRRPTRGSASDSTWCTHRGHCGTTLGKHTRSAAIFPRRRCRRGSQARWKGVYLAKGARASAAIEGDGLNEEQAVAAVEGTLEVPQSQEYLQQELENVIRALANIETEVHRDGKFKVTPEKLRSLNLQVLEGLEVEDHVVRESFAPPASSWATSTEGPRRRIATS